MPHIRIRAMTEENVKKLSLILPRELAELINTPEDNFTIEKVATTFYHRGETVSEGVGDPMIEMHWFDRGKAVKASVATLITQIVRNHTTSEFIAVVFYDLPKENYFENGAHF